MRVAVGLLAVTVLAGAGEPGASIDEAHVRRLVALLASDEPGVRRHAHAGLVACGEGVLPLLARMEAHDPEVARALRMLTRATRTLKLRVTPPGPLRLGAPFELDLRVRNDTDTACTLPLVVPAAGEWKTARSALHLEIDGTRVALGPGDVRPTGAGPAAGGQEGDGSVTLRPGGMVRLRVRVASPSRGFLTQPGSYEVRVAYAGPVTRSVPGERPEHVVETLVRTESTSGVVELRSDTLVLDVAGSAPALLDAALRGSDRAARAAAVAELRMRDDAAVLPVLRRNVDDPALRLDALRRLGAAGEEQDLPLLLDATGPDASTEVRRAAIAGLGGYPTSRKARARLIGYTRDFELKEDAIRALKHHRHPVTIDCFVRLLRLGQLDGALAEGMIETLREWTDVPLSNRASEIRRFERWWINHRMEWWRTNRPAR